MSASSEHVVHLVILPCAGMGHLNPCLRIAALFLRYGCKITLITPKPTVSLAESNLISRFCSSFPQVTQIDLNLITLDPNTVKTNDPFWLQYETVRRSVPLVAPILSSLSTVTPLSAFIFDIFLISPVIPIIEKLSCPSYTYFTSSAIMFSFYAYLSVLAAANPGAHPCSFIDVIEIPGIASPIPRSSVPPLLLQPNSVLESIFMADSPKLTKLNGIFINSFEELEEEALAALNEGKVVKGLPPVYPLGPLMACEFDKEDQGKRGSSMMRSILRWLDEQDEASVVYVCLGSRTETRKEQIKDTALGLIESGYRFLWVVKLKVVDIEEEEGLEDVLGSELMSKVREKGLVVKEYVDQMAILGHPAVGGFLNHGGWNSITETVWEGVPILTWPQHGDQKITSESVRRSEVGIWPEDWGWGTEEVVKGKEIAKRLKEMMSNESLRVKAAAMKEAARKAAGIGGSVEVIIKRQIEEWKSNVHAT